MELNKIKVLFLGIIRLWCIVILVFFRFLLFWVSYAHFLRPCPNAIRRVAHNHIKNRSKGFLICLGHVEHKRWDVHSKYFWQRQAIVQEVGKNVPRLDLVKTLDSSIFCLSTDPVPFKHSNVQIRSVHSHAKIGTRNCYASSAKERVIYKLTKLTLGLISH